MMMTETATRISDIQAATLEPPAAEKDNKKSNVFKRFIYILRSFIQTVKINLIRYRSSICVMPYINIYLAQFDET
jgi:hypothetical protein